MPLLSPALRALACRKYEQDSHDQLVKTIEGQDLLPQVGWCGWALLGAAGRCWAAGLTAWRMRLEPCCWGLQQWHVAWPAATHTCALSALLPPQGVFTMLLKKIYKRQK